MPRPSAATGGLRRSAAHPHREAAALRPKLEHAWPASPEEAVALQEELKARVERSDRIGRVRRIAGVDVHFDRGGTRARAAVVVLTFPELEWQDVCFGRAEVPAVYRPGLLSLGAMPAVLDALTTVCAPPDLFLGDAQGLAHPRRFGFACHLGVLFDRPAIGVAKGRLVGEHEPVPEGRGSWRPLVDRGEVVGAALRTRDHARPLYVSIGHRVSLGTAIDLVLAAAPRYRLPEPLRQAHRWAGSRG
ncbi:MAG TPA: deoxyribonuclease V [Thermoanaerobaculia bacterium]|nr:deoxyribonuclease V [Thermoanaerobaculia bacterium]